MISALEIYLSANDEAASDKIIYTTTTETVSQKPLEPNPRSQTTASGLQTGLPHTQKSAVIVKNSSIMTISCKKKKKENSS